MYGDICMDWAYVCRAVAVLFDGPLIDFLTISIDGDPVPHLPSNVLKIRGAAAGLGNGDTMLSLREDIDYQIPSLCLDFWSNANSLTRPTNGIRSSPCLD
jgi:hypothetical protein